MNMQKNRGPRTEPWGTPRVTTPLDDREPLTLTFCVLLERYDLRNRMGSGVVGSDIKGLDTKGSGIVRSDIKGSDFLLLVWELDR